MATFTPIEEAVRYLRRLINANPSVSQGAQFVDDVTVINMEHFGNCLLLDLDDGTTISLSITREFRDEHDQTSLDAKLAAKAVSS